MKKRVVRKKRRTSTARLDARLDAAARQGFRGGLLRAETMVGEVTLAIMSLPEPRPGLGLQGLALAALNGYSKRLKREIAELPDERPKCDRFGDNT